MYVIKVVPRVKPGAFDIVDHESDIRWYPIRLDGTQINTEDTGTRIRFTHYASQMVNEL